MKNELDDMQFLGRVIFGVLPDSPTSQFKNTATPEVTNGTVFKCSGSVVTVTNFIGGQDGQRLYLKGDGTTIISNNTTIKTNTGANKLLGANRMYVFVYFDSDKLWVEA